MLVLVLLVLPEGIIPSLGAGYDWLRQPRRPAGPTPRPDGPAGGAGVPGPDRSAHRSGAVTRWRPDATLSPVLLQTQKLSVNFGAVRACDGISLTVARNEILGVVGPNGSGKTTLFRCICGEIRPSEGTTRWHGKEIDRWPTDRIARSGLVRTFQQSTFFGSMTVRENLVMAAACVRSIGPRDTRRPDEIPDTPVTPDDILELCGLADVGRQSASAQPTGVLRLLGVAVALATRPSMLMLDEPGAGLNGQEAAALAEVLLRLHASGLSLVVVDHDMSFLLPISTRLVVLSAGQKIKDGPPKEIVEDAEVVRIYLGENYRSGKVTSERGA